MTATVADVTQIFPATFTAKGLIAALYTHFNTVSTRFSVAASNGASNDEGLLLTCDKAGEPWNIALRDGGTTNMRVSIDAEGDMDDPGGTGVLPTGYTDWSGTVFENVFSLAGGAVGCKTWIMEMPDAFFVRLTNSANTFGLQIGHWGRVEALWDAEEFEQLGRTGLGLHAGQPGRVSTSATSGFFITTLNSLAHVRTGEWSSTKLGHENFTASQNNELERPSPICLTTDNANGSTYDDTMGYMKYCRKRNQASRAVNTRLESTPSDQAWIHDNYVASTTSYVYPWRKGVSP